MGARVRLRLLVQEPPEAEACNERRPRSPALVRQRLLLAVFVAVEVRFPRGIDLLQTAPEVD